MNGGFARERKYHARLTPSVRCAHQIRKPHGDFKRVRRCDVRVAPSYTARAPRKIGPKNAAAALYKNRNSCTDFRASTQPPTRIKIFHVITKRADKAPDHQESLFVV